MAADLVALGWCWWTFMLLVTIFNGWLLMYTFKNRFKGVGGDMKRPITECQRKWLDVGAIIFTVVCAYRSWFPRIDVTPQTCWFDTPLNWIVFGRATATVAEVMWAIQMCVFHETLVAGIHYGDGEDRSAYSPSPRFSRRTHTFLARLAVFLACAAECCSWTCLSTENQAFCTSEESLWTTLFLVFFVIMVQLWRSLGDSGIQQRINNSSAYGVGLRGYSVFLFVLVLGQALQVCLYAVRYSEDQEDAKVYKNFGQGFVDLAGCDNVSTNMDDWWADAGWMTPYFSVCVWSSIWLAKAPFAMLTPEEDAKAPLLA